VQGRGENVFLVPNLPAENHLKKRRRNLIASLVTLLVVLGALFELLTPATELTRFRNSLLAGVGEPADFNWVPGDEPAEYKLETLYPPAILADIGREIRLPSRLVVPQMIELVKHLRTKPKRRGPIKSTTVETYKQIVENGRGYCADYTQVFNGLAHSVTLPVREWGMSFDRFSGDGHAFSEVYDESARQWIFVDPLNSFYVTDHRSGRPLSVLEFRDRLTIDSGFDSIDIVPIGETFLFKSDRDAFGYFQKGATQFYLWFGNNVFTYDHHPVVRLLGPISRSAEQLAAIVLGLHPEIRILPTNTNSSEIAALLRLRYQALGLMVLACLIGIFACIQAVRLLRETQNSQKHSAAANS